MAEEPKEFSPPLGALLVTHGDLGESLLRVVEKILGKKPEVVAVRVGWDDDVNDLRKRIQESVDGVENGRGVLILTDMFGGTPTNVVLPFLKEDNAEVITGVNLPMLVKVGSLQHKPGTLREAADELRKVGQRAIQLASQYLERPHEQPPG